MQMPRPGQQPLYYHRSRPPGYVTSSVVKTGMKWSTTINAGERTWILIAYPTTSFISRHRTWQSWTDLRQEACSSPASRGSSSGAGSADAARWRPR